MCFLVFDFYMTQAASQRLKVQRATTLAAAASVLAVGAYTWWLLFLCRLTQAILMFVLFIHWQLKSLLKAYVRYPTIITPVISVVLRSRAKERTRCLSFSCTATRV